MPITIKPTQLKYKDPSTSQYVPIVAAANGSSSSSVDVQINGTSILNNEVANIPEADNETYGVLKTGYSTSGLQKDASGYLKIYPATSDNIKAGTEVYRPIVPYHQHESVFYGLAKAAGADMASSSNAVGTYTDTAKNSICNMIGAVKPSNLWYAQISNSTYTELFGGEFTVTTAEDSTHIKPFARASITGIPNKQFLHRVTINGTSYILPVKLWFEGNKTYPYIGNLKLFVEDTSGNTYPNSSESFIIIFDYNDGSAIDILTSTAGTYIIKIEKLSWSYTKIPNTLIYGVETAPLHIINNGSSTYDAYSLGVNAVSGATSSSSARGSMVMGFDNISKGQFNMIAGIGNNITGNYNIALGASNGIFGNSTYNIGRYNSAETDTYGNYLIGESNIVLTNTSYSISAGFGLINNSSFSCILGNFNVTPQKISYPAWTAGTAYEVGDIVIIDEKVIIRCDTANEDETFVQSKWTRIYQDSNVLFIVGNGEPNSRSNGLMLEQNGTLHLMGDIYTNCNNDSTGGIKIPHDIQINGTSIVNNGVANIPIGSTTTPGVFKRGSGLYQSDGALGVNTSSDENIKGGVVGTFTTVQKQHIATFYGLAKAAGDSTQSASSNAVGVYTDNAKAQIQKMLGVYQQPWEFIREDTFTNATEADHIITLDTNNEAFDLTDIIFMFETPVQDTDAAKGSYGQIHFYYGTNDYFGSESGAWTQAANGSAHGFMVRIIQEPGGMFWCQETSQTTSTNSAPWRTRYFSTFKSGSQGLRMLENNYVRHITKIVIKTVTGTGHYLLYGKRAIT